MQETWINNIHIKKKYDQHEKMEQIHANVLLSISHEKWIYNKTYFLRVFFYTSNKIYENEAKAYIHTTIYIEEEICKKKMNQLLFIQKKYLSDNHQIEKKCEEGK